MTVLGRLNRQQWWAYRRRSLTLTPTEQSLMVDVVARLPRRIIDSHTHCNLPEHVGALPESYRRLPLTTFPHYTLDDAQYSRTILWPDHHVTSLRFAGSFHGIDHRAANTYLLENVADYGDEFVCYGIPDDVAYTKSLLKHPAVRALKMYHRYRQPAATTLAEFLPDPILANAAEVGVPLVLHLPQPPAHSADELVHVMSAHPNLRVILAHVGTARPGSLDDLEALRMLSRRTNVSLDTAVVMDSVLLEQALLLYGPDRVMYGSDEPLSQISVAEYEHPEKGRQWVSATRYHWLDETDAATYGDRTGPEMLIHFAELRAIHDAIARLFSGDQYRKALEEVFRGAALRLFALTEQRLRDTEPHAFGGARVALPGQPEEQSCSRALPWLRLQSAGVHGTVVL
jgi:predicted TIM-barrel fold metal-dependent hydrolase